MENNKSERKYYPLFTRYQNALELLSDMQLGRLIRAMLVYSESGEEPTDLDEITDVAFRFMKLDYDKWREEKNSMIARSAG